MYLLRDWGRPGQFLPSGWAGSEMLAKATRGYPGSRHGR
jgi:hypothetical protein